jgi:hypothetical protein
MTDAQDNSAALTAVRIGDTDRELAARQLQIAVDDGRLDLMELDRRLVAICRALVADACSLRRGTRTGTRPRLRAVARPGTGIPAVTPMSLRRAARLHR